eukprot:CAMPEP_0114417820 /NCGR_PEP_ID=MMETSP0103-20121206/3168_1 /TAXON_ID=37642 ORGANISM="Paraphysomonas imperforata, Strain PA2" /NCGR_SAMPLE_ID=MMETSP0103 /ASSEMBLY_ACC=CAM_ASM_000201 /LENGTH=207 /DNA_ID=CAMNT_0001586139 /DNA_START=78 /DNA_END=701 /DNA_ORIENTATION=+
MRSGQLCNQEFEKVAVDWIETQSIFETTSSDSVLTYGGGLPCWELMRSERKQVYLKMSIRAVRCPASLQAQSTSQEDLCSLEDHSCDTDDVTAAPLLSPDTVSTEQGVLDGWIHILLHPVYQVPCPFLQVSLRASGDDEGRPLPPSSVETILRTWRHFAQQEWREQELLPVELVEEEHPVLGVPASCLHILACPISGEASVVYVISA